MSQPAATGSDDVRLGLFEQIKGLDNRFWIVNVMEMFERLAYYGVRAVIAIYMVLALEEGGPEFTHVQKGQIFAAWAAVQSVLPAFTGGFADRYGHKNTIAVAIAIKIVGYLFMAQFKTYGLFFLGCVLLAAGTAIFKPGVQGTLAASLKKSNASVGWGIFYQLVNIGGFLGPVLAGVLRLLDWKYVFWSCAVIVAINYLWLPFYQDPTQEAGYGAKDEEGQDQGDRNFASLSQAVSDTLAAGWASAGAFFSLLWFGGVFGFAPQYASVVGADGHAAWLPLAIVGSLLAVGSLGAGAIPALRKVAAGLSATMFVLAVVAIAADWHSPALAVLSQVESSLAGPLRIIGAAGVYLVPTGAGLGAVLYWFSAEKEYYDAGHSGPVDVAVVSVVGLFQHRVLWFCMVFAGFWFMFNQVFDLLPNVIDDWVDSSGLILTVGTAFGNPVVPSLLALFFGVVLGGVCAVGVLLAMRPDRQAPDQISDPAYAVVALALTGAASLGLAPLLGGWAVVAGAVLGVLSALAIRFTRTPAKLVAGAASAVGALGSFLYFRRVFLESAPDLVAMARAGEQVNPEWMINLNPGLIVFTMVFFAYLSSFMRPLSSIIVGMVIATLGSLIAGTAVLGWICLAGVLVFSVGEMLSSPKKMEYLATLSKKGQEGLFMGYANIPVAIGWISGSLIAGNLYEEHGDKTNLARKHLIEVVGMDSSTVEAMQKTDVLPTLSEKLGMSAMDAQHLLFDTYHPETIWYQIAAIGLASIIGMILYDRAIKYVDGQGAGTGEEKAA